MEIRINPVIKVPMAKLYRLTVMIGRLIPIMHRTLLNMHDSTNRSQPARNLFAACSHPMRIRFGQGMDLLH